MEGGRGGRREANSDGGEKQRVRYLIQDEGSQKHQLLGVHPHDILHVLDVVLVLGNLVVGRKDHRVLRVCVCVSILCVRNCVYALLYGFPINTRGPSP